MLPATELLKLYRAERDALDMPSDPFPPFADWRAAFDAEYRATHVTNYKTVDVKVAMAEADAAVEEADMELSMMELNEEMEMNETNVSGVVAAVAPLVVDVDAQAPVGESSEPVAAAPVKRKSYYKAKGTKTKAKSKAKAAPKKKAARKVAKSTKARVARKDNKTAQARTIFDRMFGKKERKDVIAAFIEKVGLSANGASTYYQKFKATA